MFNLTIFLGSFINDWWDAIRKFFHEMNSIVKILIITLLFLTALLSFVRCFKPMYSADKNKSKILPIIGTILFTALACLIIFI
jgi:hypothetical protein